MTVSPPSTVCWQWTRLTCLPRPHVREQGLQTLTNQLKRDSNFLARAWENYFAINPRNKAALFKDVRSNYFCASLRRMQIHKPCHASMPTLSNKMHWTTIGQMAIAIALPGFNAILDVLWPLFFFLMDHFLCRFSTFNENIKKIYRLKVEFFGKMHHRISLFFSSLFLCAVVQMPLEGLSFVKTMVTFSIIYAIDPPLQNMTKIVCLPGLTLDIFNYKPL